MDIHVTNVNWFSTYHVHHRVAAHFQMGRAFLAGDAGHIHSPAGGQGMNTGIGDAVNLSWKLANVINGQANESLLATYETERIAFARKLISTTDRAFRSIVNQERTGRFVRTWLLPNLLSVLTGFSAVRRVIFNTVSQVRISYHQSSLSEGQAGDIMGGDRLPWVESAQGSNFDSLTSLNWRVHIYGEVEPDFREALAEIGLPLDNFEWNDDAEDAGFEIGAMYLIRPDGYVALAEVDQDIEIVKDYLDKFEFNFVEQQQA